MLFLLPPDLSASLTNQRSWPGGMAYLFLKYPWFGTPAFLRGPPTINVGFKLCICQLWGSICVLTYRDFMLLNPIFSNILTHLTYTELEPASYRPTRTLSPLVDGEWLKAGWEGVRYHLTPLSLSVVIHANDLPLVSTLNYRFPTSRL